jgi:hypothetical protein
MGDYLRMREVWNNLIPVALCQADGLRLSETE